MRELTEKEKEAFSALGDAFVSGRAYLVLSKRKDDGKEVPIICILNPDSMDSGNDMVMAVTPVAALIEGDPHDIYEDPTGMEAESEWKSNGKETR